MKIIEPKVELWRQEDAKAHVARCARVCYGKETGNDEATVKRLINSKHWSMFRHETVYAMIPIELWYGNFGEILKGYKASPYISWVTVRDYIYVSTNGNFMLDIENMNLFYIMKLIIIELVKKNLILVKLLIIFLLVGHFV